MMYVNNSFFFLFFPLKSNTTPLWTGCVAHVTEPPTGISITSLYLLCIIKYNSWSQSSKVRFIVKDLC